jgi:hypothetical protein
MASIMPINATTRISEAIITSIRVKAWFRRAGEAGCIRNAVGKIRGQPINRAAMGQEFKQGADGGRRTEAG